MREKIDLFLPCDDLQEARFTTIDLHEDKTVQHINLLVSADFAAQHPVPEALHLPLPLTALRVLTQ